MSGEWERFAGRHLYLDANVFIGLLEGDVARQSRIRDLFILINRGDILASTSELTLAEVLVQPLARGAVELVRNYEAALGGAVAIVPLNRAVMRGAAQYRAETLMDLPDSIHVTSAMAAGCDVFVTGDGGIVLPGGMERAEV